MGWNKEFGGVLSIPEKREFYSGMARLIRSGTSLPNALALLARDAPARPSVFLKALSERVLAGQTLGDAMAARHVSELEAGIVAATERSGRLDRGCDQLARYFQALVDARAALRKRLAYPAAVLHLAIFSLTLPNVLLSGGGVREYLQQTIGWLVVIYAGATLAILTWNLLSQSARSNAGLDAVLDRVPGIGAIRRNFALARFFAALDAQLEGSVNIWDAFANAARASNSGRLLRDARLAMPMLQQGEPLSEALSRHGVVPAPFIRAFRVAEQSGELDKELPRMAQETEADALGRLERLSGKILPSLIYAMVVLWIVWQLVHAMRLYTNFLEKIGGEQ